MLDVCWRFRERTNKRTNEQTKQTNEQMNKRINEQSNKRTNEQTNKRTNEQTNKRTNERTNIRTNERTNEQLYLDGYNAVMIGVCFVPYVLYTLPCLHSLNTIIHNVDKGSTQDPGVHDKARITRVKAAITVEGLDLQDRMPQEHTSNL